MRALETSLFDFTQVAFLAGQEEENEFPETGVHLKNRFLDLTKVDFWACQEAQNDISAIRGLNRMIFSLVKKQKMSSPCLGTTRKFDLLNSRKSYFVLFQRPRNWLNMPYGSLKQRFLDLNKVAFRDGQEAVNEFKVTWKLETSLSRLLPSRILSWSRGRK